MKRAIIDDPSRIWGSDPLKTVQAYLPLRFEARMEGTAIVIEGDDYAGWTMEDYVIPRLASAGIFPRIEEDT